MSREDKIVRKTASILVLVIAIMTVLAMIAFIIPINLLAIARQSPTAVNVIEYAPEVWLSLLALVFGTLIIVISIASENTPKLIDLFIGDYKSRLYIWLITFSSLENLYLQLFSYNNSPFPANLIFLNGYVLLPFCVLIAIPYTFYILKYTRNSNVIKKIYDENILAIRAAKKMGVTEKGISMNHLALFESINQLHDLLQYIQFKEPKADIIHRMGMSLRIYLGQKKKFPPSYFHLSDSVKSDISFRTLGEKYSQIEEQKTFYEQKVLRVLGTSYLLLIKDSHYDLASLCGSELFETGRIACFVEDSAAVDTVLAHFNTIIRYGINQGLRGREIRNVYNTIFHYSQLVNLFAKRRDEARVIQCCQYFNFYANELGKLSLSEPLFVILIEAFAVELKRILILLHSNGFPREMQNTALRMFNDLSSQEKRNAPYRQRSNHIGVGLIQVALCLFYMSRDEEEFNEKTIDHIVKDLAGFDEKEAKHIISVSCDRIALETEEFWEETDQGNRNIFFSPDKNQLTAFRTHVFSRIEQHYQEIMPSNS